MRLPLALALSASLISPAWAMSQMDLPAGYPPSAIYQNGALFALIMALVFMHSDYFLRSASAVKSLWWGAAMLIMLSGTAYALDSDGTEPDPVMTPGAVRTTDRSEICDTRTKSVRNVSGSEKLAVYRRYGMVGPSGTFPGTSVQGPWEIDHLVSLELGGSNDITNLWPESYNQAMGAHEKDALENKLHKLVCSGQMTVEDAQHSIATDWVAAYRKYVAPNGASQ